MSYLDYPRVHFSGSFRADPSTINNVPNNYNPEVYPSPNALDKVELYWNPFGSGSFTLKDCTVARIEYSPTDCATTKDEDPIIGQPVTSVPHSGGHYLPGGAIVDLDPMQQNVSEIWGLQMQIGGDDTCIKGDFTPVSFNGIWIQCQGPTAPRSSASGSAVYQTQLTGISITDTQASKSKFLGMLQGQTSLSINMVVNAHNNAPDTYAFNANTFAQMQSKGVSTDVLNKLEPLGRLFMLYDRNPDGSAKTNPDGVAIPQDLGIVPSRSFVDFMIKQLLTAEEYNASYEAVYGAATIPYQPITPYAFTYGGIYGTVGQIEADAPAYFVPSRMMAPTQKLGISPMSPLYYAPFTFDESSKLVTLNLGNSISTITPGTAVYSSSLGDLWLVKFPNGEVNVNNAQKLAQIPYTDTDLITKKAGFFTYQATEDLSATPLGIMSVTGSVDSFTDASSKRILLAENAEGYYLRANQFVFRMNPGKTAGTETDATTAQIYALKFGKPVPDGTQIELTLKTEAEAEKYTAQTPGESGSLGIKKLSIPQDALKIANTTVGTVNGVATFDISCTDPGNPRSYVNGQVYFVNYNFADASISSTINQDPNDLLSIQVYSQNSAEEAVPTLQKFGRLYKVMSFLTSEEKINSLDYRNLIKTFINKPMESINHMPLTRDMSDAERAEITAYIDGLNNPTT